MKRLHKITDKELLKWLEKRQETGTIKYGDMHLKRYNAVDVVEELLDVINITEKWADRLEKDERYNGVLKKQLSQLKMNAFSLIRLVQQIDEQIPNSSCTDENGGERIWW